MTADNTRFQYIGQKDTAHNSVQLVGQFLIKINKRRPPITGQLDSWSALRTADGNPDRVLPWKLALAEIEYI